MIQRVAAAPVGKIGTTICPECGGRVSVYRMRAATPEDPGATVDRIYPHRPGRRAANVGAERCEGTYAVIEPG